MHISNIFSKEINNKIKEGDKLEDCFFPKELIIKINEILFETGIDRFPIKIIVPSEYKQWKENIEMEEITENYTAINIFLNPKQTKKTIRFNNLGIEIYNSTKLIYGKYLKYRRDLYQTNHRGVLGISSFLNYLKIYYNADDIIFSGLGREDIDVMNLTGRDFLLKIINPKINLFSEPPNKYNINDLKENLFAFYNLKIVNSKIQSLFKSNPQKEYQCLIVVKSENKIKNIQLNDIFLKIKQKTPLRVLHRRTDLIRDKQILITNFYICNGNINNPSSCFYDINSLNIKNILLKNYSISKKEVNYVDNTNKLLLFDNYIKPDDYFFSIQDPIQQELINKVKNINKFNCKCISSFKNEEDYFLINMNLISSSGTYIKEFVHGDFGRTKGSLKDILTNYGYKNIELEMIFLNVVQLIY